MTSKVKVNTVETESGSTLTLGKSGDTVTLASGASQSGFGRTGTVDWQTTPKTASFTAVNGEGYFVNTTSGAITMTMPSGSAGAIVSIQDYNKTFDSNSLTVAPATGEKINGGVADGSLIVSTEGQGITFVYVDSTVGWKTIQENAFTAGGSIEITATGGTITTCGNYKIHTFTSPGTFCVSQISNTPANNTVSYMVVAGGASGGASYGGGGGAGGFREYKSPVDCYSASPLNGNPGGTAITVTATGYPITVGGGGTAVCAPNGGNNGSNSVFSTVTSAGGGGGGGNPSPTTKSDGGSGGGGGAFSPSPYSYSSFNAGAIGNTPPVTPPQGSSGGQGVKAPNGVSAGGGGGATGLGGDVTSPSPGPNNTTAGPGGAGATTSISGTPTAYAGGGGGATEADTNGKGTGGTGGGGTGRFASSPTNTEATAGTANTGGGGGGGGPLASGAGGSGIVIIRYKFQ